jgi:hypothetical protein
MQSSLALPSWRRWYLVVEPLLQVGFRLFGVALNVENVRQVLLVCVVTAGRAGDRALLVRRHPLLLPAW